MQTKDFKLEQKLVRHDSTEVAATANPAPTPTPAGTNGGGGNGH